ncbi:streptophobe family protein [Streptomyces sp. LHD-70]|uniref:streptophobe family protein n=1 Tax=Streptomyces sp. LHD-70 TaxID=3072140 RepID=UPI00280C9576|nr:streptophobe family protein [Streptomyces sp. LHD-70]MDQ8701151.1 streptophobe family protein [Streptomyces sp. LHD-70]
MSRTTTTRSVRGAASTEAAAPARGTGPGKAGAEPSSPRPSGGAARHALEGGLAVMAAIAAMAVAGYLALRALGADGSAPLTQLVPAVISLAFGGKIGLAADLAPKAGAGAGAGASAGGGMLDMLGGGGGGGGGLSLGVAGQVGAMPLMVTFLGAAVLGWCFFRPLRRRMRPAPALLIARTGGALGVTAVIAPVLAYLARGTLTLPESVAEKLGKGGSGGGLGKLTGGGGISSVDFTTDIALTGFLAVLEVALVIGLGCLAARRTSLPGPVALSRARLKWNPVASTLTGIFTALCTVALFLALLAGAAAATGRDQAAKAAGALLLAAPNLISTVLTSGLGASWQAGLERRQPEGGGMMGGLGGMGGGAGGMGGAGGLGGATGSGSGADGGAKQIDLSGKAVAGLPLWLIGLTLLACLLVYAGYRTGARTPARTAREESNAVLGRHLEIALRAGVAVGLCVLALGLVSQVSVGIGFSLMGNEMGGMDAGLDGSVRLPALTGSVLAGLACYAGSRLHAVRAGRQGARTGPGRVGGGLRPRPQPDTGS